MKRSMPFHELTQPSVRRILFINGYVTHDLEATMQTKLTLRLEDQLIEQAKSYAAQAGKSVSQVVADYFKLLTTDTATPPSPPAPITQSLRGVLRDSKLDESDYKKYLEGKHL